jgi:hypothetical protein
LFKTSKSAKRDRFGSGLKHDTVKITECWPHPQIPGFLTVFRMFKWSRSRTGPPETLCSSLCHFAGAGTAAGSPVRARSRR